MSEDEDALVQQWESKKEESRQRRAGHRERAPVTLRQNSVAFTSHNDGAHLVVEQRIDYWPGTGLWRDKRTGESARGIASLLRHVAKVREL